MIKDESKEQISLFDLPQPEKPTEKPPTREKQLKAATGAAEPPTLRTAPQKRQEPVKPASRAATGTEAVKAPVKRGAAAKAAPGPVPEGDVRLTANIRQDLHLKLKIVAATRRTTIGELIEELVEQYL